ncbi:MAG: hypothetical protein NUV44_07500 [Candidatus Scalindua sp.]|nr:hypothetical protein [Candidatus Scalindua sp.]
MKKTILKEIKIKLPSNVIETVSNKEIITMLLDKALSKAEYYHSRCNEMEEKYGMEFSSFKKKIDEAKNEKFSDWDDFILWEGYMLGSEEWDKKYEELNSCRE